MGDEIGPVPGDNPFGDNPFGSDPFGGMDMSALFGQMQKMFQPHEGPINFAMATDVARHVVAAQGPDPAPHSAQSGAVADAVQLAEGWLERATTVPTGATSSVAWSRAQWVEETAEAWRRLIEPIASHVVDAMGTAMGGAIPEEAKQMAGPLLGMLNQAGGAIFGQQIGQAMGALAAEVLSSTDIGLPLGPARTVAIVPTNVAAFGEGLEHRAADVMLYVTLRECAHHRLFQHASWLRGAVENAVTEFGRGTRIDMSGIESKLAGFDPSQLQEALQSGLFEPERTPEQDAAIQRLETLLAFIEGWVDDVVDQATADRMPAAAALGEAMRRRRAAGGPAEQAFASLVGLELRPRRLRDARTLWASLRDRFGADARDQVWTHPDLMPSASDLDDPLGFTPHTSDAAFDAELGQLLNPDE